MSEMQPRDPMLSVMPALLRSILGSPLGSSSLRMMEEGALAVDISEGKDGQTIVRASLPGFKKEDVHLSVHDGVLDIKAEHRADEAVEEETYYRRERTYGSLSRRIALPGNPKEDDVDASLVDGVLTVTIRQVSDRGPKRISIA